MAYQQALSEADVQKLNLKSIRTWIETNKGKIKAKAGKTVLYSGREYDLEVLPDMKPEDRKEFMGTPVYKYLEEARKGLRTEYNLPSDFQMLGDVLKTISTHPPVVNRDRQPLRFSNAAAFFNDILELGKLLPDANRVKNECWDRLSEIFASNAEGDIAIVDRAADDYGKLGEGHVLIKRELGALLKNSKLSKAGKETLMKTVAKYSEHFDRRYKELLQLKLELKKRLKK